MNSSKKTCLDNISIGGEEGMTHIAYVVNARIPTEKAHGLQIIQMCQALGKRVDTELTLYMPKRKNFITESVAEFYDIQPRFDTKIVWSFDKKIFSSERLRFLLQYATFFITILFRHRREIAACDIVYTRSDLVALLFKNVLLERHSMPKKVRWYHRYVWQKARWIAVLTSALKQDMIEAGVPERTLAILPDAVDPEAFDIEISQLQAKTELDLPRQKQIVMYTGSFFRHEWKGVDVLIQAAELFVADSSVCFVFVGGTKNEVAALQGKHLNCLFLEAVEHKLIPRYLKAADVLVLPNKHDNGISTYHTSPMKMFEYMASGRPIVASDLPSIRDILDRDSATFFDPNDPHALAAQIQKVLSNKALVDMLTSNAKERASIYTWDNRACLVLKNSI